MKSDVAKVMHRVLGRPMIQWVVQSALDAGATRVVVIVGHQREVVQDWLTSKFGDRVQFAVQAEQRGTGHAVWCAREFLSDEAPSRTIILSGDVPNMQAQTIKEFVERVGGASVGVMTAVLDDPARYGRIVRRGERVAGIVEYADATDDQREIREINSGIYVADTKFLREELEAICSRPPETAQNEWYLTDIVGVAAEAGEAAAWILGDVPQMQGVNTRAHLAQAAAWRRERVNEAWMEAGVTMIDPCATYIDADVSLSEGVILHPGVQLLGATVVGEGTVVENSSVIENTTIGADVRVKPFCHFEDARVEDGAQMGPMCHLRPGADIGADCHVGNFVELKKTRLGPGSNTVVARAEFAGLPVTDSVEWRLVAE